MEELRLTAQELLFAGAQLGAKVFYGLPDPFYGMTLEKIRREMTKMQLSLAQKGCAELGFDDAFSLKEEVRELVEVCAKCQSYLMVRLTPPGEKTRQLLFYAGEKGVVEIQEQGGELTLRWAGPDEVATRVLALLPPAAGGGEAFSVSVTQGELAEIQALAIDAPQKALEQLVGRGCPTPMASLLVQGLRREVTRCVLCRSDFRAHAMDEMLLLQGKDGAVCLTLEDAAEERWKADFLPGGATEETLQEQCELKGAADEVL